MLGSTHTHPFNGPLSGTTKVSRYQKGKTNLELLKQETVSNSSISWAICTSLQTDNHASTPPLFFTGWMPFLRPNQQHQSTEGNALLGNFNARWAAINRYLLLVGTTAANPQQQCNG